MPVAASRHLPWSSRSCYTLTTPQLELFRNLVPVSENTLKKNAEIQPAVPFTVCGADADAMMIKFPRVDFVDL